MSAYRAVGGMDMPADFKYCEVIRRGRPHHDKWDSFRIRHPSMAPARWAKIFSPFDALDGFDERISEKEELYISRSELSEGEKEELDRRLGILHSLTKNSRLARKNTPSVTITYFSPCSDPQNEWYECGGKYLEISGIVLKVSMDEIRLMAGSGETDILFEDIRKIESSIFDDDWET